MPVRFSVWASFVYVKGRFCLFLRGENAFYTFYTFYNVKNESVIYSTTFLQTFYKFLQIADFVKTFYKILHFLHDFYKCRNLLKM